MGAIPGLASIVSGVESAVGITPTPTPAQIVSPTTSPSIFSNTTFLVLGVLVVGVVVFVVLKKKT